MKISFLSMLLFFGAVLNGLALAEEPKKDPPKTPDKDAKAEEPDMYKAPDDATSDQLLAYCKTLMTFRPKTQAEATAHAQKARAALTVACKKILEMEKDPKSFNAHFANQTLLMLGMAKLTDPKSPEFDKYVEEVGKWSESERIEREDVALFSRVASQLQYVDAAKAKTFYERLDKNLAKNTDATVASFKKSIPAVLRRLNLPGHEMELKGKTVDGKDFDVTSLKGKVVLVDFWATWCGPCRAELPNVKKNYEGYHNKGFEVVGISGDRDRDALEKFLKEDPLPWTTLHEMENGEYKPNAAMEQYGIMAFPTTLMIGKDGKVIALSARGPQLSKLLKDQLGDPEPPKEPAKDTAKEPAKDAKADAKEAPKAGAK